MTKTPPHTQRYKLKLNALVQSAVPLVTVVRANGLISATVECCGLASPATESRTKAGEEPVLNVEPVLHEATAFDAQRIAVYRLADVAGFASLLIREFVDA